MIPGKQLRHPTPIGTLKELEAIGFLDPGEYYTCGPRKVDEGIAGCPFYQSCKLRGGKAHGYDFQGEVIRGESGPQVFGVQELANKSTGRKVINTIRACYEMPGLEARAEASRHIRERGFVVRIIAREGGEIRVATHAPVDEDIPGQGRRRVYKPTVVVWPVPKHPRPKDNPALAGDQFAAEEAARFMQEQDQGDTSEFFGQVQMEAKKPRGRKAEDGGDSGKPASRG